MTAIDLDFGAIQVPVGEFPATLEGVEVKTSNAGNEMFVWNWQVPNENGAAHNIVSRTVFNTKWLQKTIYALTGETPSGKISIDTEQMVGRNVTLILEEGTTQDGQPSGFPQVKAVLPAVSSAAV